MKHFGPYLQHFGIFVAISKELSQRHFAAMNGRGSRVLRALALPRKGMAPSYFCQKRWTAWSTQVGMKSSLWRTLAPLRSLEKYSSAASL